MAEFTYNPVQTIPANQAAIFNTTIPCNKGYVYHRNESGIVILRGIVNNACAGFARYMVTFKANIALSEGATVGPIAVALTIDGEVLPTSRAMAPTKAVGDFFNVSSVSFITVPKGCCFNISVENVSNPAASIDMQNANLVVSRTA